MKNQLKIWKEKKLWPLTVDHFRDNEDSISFFIFSYLVWNEITTKLTSIPGFPYIFYIFPKYSWFLYQTRFMNSTFYVYSWWFSLLWITFLQLLVARLKNFTCTGRKDQWEAWNWSCDLRPRRGLKKLQPHGVDTQVIVIASRTSTLGFNSTNVHSPTPV